MRQARFGTILYESYCAAIVADFRETKEFGENYTYEFYTECMQRFYSKHVHALYLNKRNEDAPTWSDQRTMSKLKVDRELFVTCRLCIEELGEYQIVPSVQLQIKQFFDIHVEPFDGLPQLICPKCNKILFEFNTIKTTFCEKQTILRKMVFEKDSQQDTVSSSQEAPETTEPYQLANHIVDEPRTSKKRNSKRKRLLLHSSSSSDVESEKSFQTSKPLKKKSSRHRGKSPMPWQADYMKMLSCQLCNSFWLSRKALASHNRSHERLRERHKDTLNRLCTVNLIKIDDKPNITGLSKMVVHSSNKIVEPGNSYFYTIYSKEDSASTNRSENNCVKNEDENKCSSQASSDGEERIVFKPKQRKRRFISRSSNETVVIESNSNKVFSDEEDSKSTVCNSIDRPLNNNQCIKIDDSSDSESDQGRLEKSEKVKQPIKPKFDDYKNFQGIISMSLNSYHKKNESVEDMLYMNVIQNKKKDSVMVSNESQLKHKVLSIGRKIINKQGFNCTGLLRYMEHKNLEVRWIDQAPSMHPKDTNYIRILTSLRGDLTLDDEPAWVNVSETSQLKPFKPVTLKKAIKIAIPNRSLINVPVSSDSTVAKIATNMVANIEMSQPEQINNQPMLDSMPAMLSYLPDSKTSISASKKLLNAYPVANPKKLPKKLGASNESRSNKTVAQPSVVCLPTDDDDNNYCLPIITSTTSLATIPSKEQIQDTNQKKSSKEQTLDTNQNNASASKAQTQDTNQNNAGKAQTQDTNQKNAGKAQTQDTNQKIASKERIQDTNQRNASKEQTHDINQANLSKEQTQDTNQKNSVSSEEIIITETPAPRIKVKPVSELMSERTLDRMKEQEQSRNVTNNNMFVSRIENVWPHQQPINIFAPNIAPQMLVTSPQIQILQMPTLNAEPAYQPMSGPTTSNNKPEHVILDTTEFPNTRTESPIKYVKDLLQLHNMFLLDPNVPLSTQFICLIKFKVVFKQDYQRDSPVILCLSLSCLKNTFCFQVKDRNQEIIDMTKISANWQWEILQTFHGDVSDKVLQNARKYGQETFDLTNKFFCLVKSIKCRKPC